MLLRNPSASISRISCRGILSPSCQKSSEVLTPALSISLPVPFRLLSRVLWDDPWRRRQGPGYIKLRSQTCISAESEENLSKVECAKPRSHFFSAQQLIHCRNVLKLRRKENNETPIYSIHCKASDLIKRCCTVFIIQILNSLD